MPLQQLRNPVDTNHTGWLPEGLQTASGAMGLAGALFEGNPDMVLIVGADGRIAGANSRALKELGYLRQDLEGQPLEMLLPVAVRESHAAHVRRYMAHPMVRPMGSCMNLKARDSSGREFPVDVALQPFAAGAEQCVLAICNRLDMPLARNRSQIHALVESTRDSAVNLLDTEGRILTWNEGARLIYGLTAEQASGMHFSVLFTPDERTAGEPQRQLDFALQSTEGVRIATWRKGADGQMLWVEGQLKATWDISGNLTGFTRLLRDRTEKKRKEEELLQANRALAESEQIFRLLVESVTDYAIYKLDPLGLVLTWNVGAERNKGYRQEEILGKNFSIFFLPEDVEAGLPAQELAAAERDGRFESQNWRIRKDGSRFWALVSLTAIRSHEGRLLGFAKVTRDMTAQKSLEEAHAQLALDLDQRVTVRTRQLESTVSELRTKNEEVEALVALVSHDLSEKEVLLREVYHRVKNNLQVVQSLLKMGARTLRSADARRAIETAVQRVHAMAMVHEHLYQMPDLTNLTLSAYLRDVVEGAIGSNCERSEQVRLILDIDEIPIPLDFAIPLGLLANELVSNCLKHGLPRGRAGVISVSAKMIPGSVRFFVEDDGPGLPDNFDAAQCTSMGVKLAASLAHQLGGRLIFSSKNGCRVQADLTRLCSQTEKLRPNAPSAQLAPVR